LIPRGNINTIFFDLDGTLRHNQPTFLEALSTYNLLLGLPAEIAHSKQGYRWLHNYWAQSAELSDDREKFGEDGVAFWVNHSRRYLIACGCSSEQAAQLSPALTEFMREDYTPLDTLDTEADELLGNLQQEGFRLGVISNRSKPFEEQLESLGIRSYFEISLAAGSIDTWKPDPKIFHHALREMNIKPEQAVYVGDNYFADVVGAQNAGIKPVLIDPDGLFPEADCMVIKTIGDLDFSSTQ